MGNGLHLNAEGGAAVINMKWTIQDPMCTVCCILYTCTSALVDLLSPGVTRHIPRTPYAGTNIRYSVQ
jgi:hypothetical protein